MSSKAAYFTTQSEIFNAASQVSYFVPYKWLTAGLIYNDFDYFCDMARCDRKGSGGTYYFEKIEFPQQQSDIANISDNNIGDKTTKIV